MAINFSKMTKRIFIALVLILTCSACGSSKEHCDAYGSLATTETKADVETNLYFR